MATTLKIKRKAIKLVAFMRYCYTQDQRTIHYIDVVACVAKAAALVESAILSPPPIIDLGLKKVGVRCTICMFNQSPVLRQRAKYRRSIAITSESNR